MPTGIEAIETGEKFEDNALPWDSISAATYTKTGDLKPFVPELLKDHDARIAKDPEFQYIQQDIARYKALKDKRDTVSLNYAQRDKEDKEDDATRLARLNERFKREGKKPLKSLDELPKDYVAPDPYLDEADNIAVELAKLLKEQGDKAPAASK
ncbi:hypothetical protein ACVW1M_003951 [Ewingella americana]